MVVALLVFVGMLAINSGPTVPSDPFCQTSSVRADWCDGGRGPGGAGGE